MLHRAEAQPQVSLRPFTTLRAGGPAEWFAQAHSVDRLAELACLAQSAELQATVLGSGSNVLPSDDGVPGLVIHNAAQGIYVRPDGYVEADAGCSFQELFLKTAQAGLGGLAFAVGIPGTLGGALVSNAGAYRGVVSEFLTEIEIVEGGLRRWVDPSWMRFSYRDSILRGPGAPACALLRVRFQLPQGDARAIFDEAREHQRQRIAKQPPPASAGSFFKNLEDPALARRLTALPDRLREAGVVPAGFLIMEVGLAGYFREGAAFSRRHANFIVNIGGARASSIRRLAEMAKSRVREAFGVHLEEEVLYLGDWSGHQPA
jgi:UDP-N-acetylmuramate dehydrogenase